VREANSHDKHQTRGRDATDRDIIICRGSLRGAMALVTQEMEFVDYNSVYYKYQGREFSSDLQV